MGEQKYSNNEIYLMLKNLKDNVEKGIKGMHDRQDFTNGNVKANTEFRIKASTGLMIIKWTIGALGFGNIVSIIYLISK